jgi:hypothetical protein
MIDTTPNVATTSNAHPFDAATNPGVPGNGVTRIQTARVTQLSARKIRPPAHHPTSAHTASAGTINSSDCSIGTTTRRSGTSGSSTNARRARMILRHPCSRGAGAGLACVLADSSF